LICTAYSPNRACGKPVNNSNQPVKSSDSRFAPVNYSPLFQVKKVGGEQVRLVVFKKTRSTEMFLRRKILLWKFAGAPIDIFAHERNHIRSDQIVLQWTKSKLASHVFSS
jgi:hypothetical protein